MGVLAVLTIVGVVYARPATATAAINPSETLVSFLQGLGSAGDLQAGECLLTVEDRDAILRQLSARPTAHTPPTNVLRLESMPSLAGHQNGSESSAASGDDCGDVTTDSNTMTARRSLTLGSQSLPVNCAFDGVNWCGWTYDDNYAWSRGSGSTPSDFTGPSADHTTGSGFYAFVESSDPNHPNVGPFTLESPTLSGGGSGALVRFYYHMYGGTMGTLQLETFNGTAWTTQWSRTGDQGQAWKMATVEVLNEVVRVRFVATSGNLYYSDMAIDDVSITGVSTTPPTSSPAPSISAKPTSSPTAPKPTSQPTAPVLEARSWHELNDALHVDRASVNVSRDIVFTRRIILDGEREVTAFCNISSSQVHVKSCATLDGGGKPKCF